MFFYEFGVLSAVILAEALIWLGGECFDDGYGWMYLMLCNAVVVSILIISLTTE